MSGALLLFRLESRLSRGPQVSEPERSSGVSGASWRYGGVTQDPEEIASMLGPRSSRLLPSDFGSEEAYHSRVVGFCGDLL